jgi:hypothetical protein
MRLCGDELFKPLHQASLHYCKDFFKLPAAHTSLNHIASAMRLPLLCAAIRVFWQRWYNDFVLRLMAAMRFCDREVYKAHRLFSLTDWRYGIRYYKISRCRLTICGQGLLFACRTASENYS